jgi:hypothetical protein
VNEVNWFRRSLKTGGVAGGIAGLVCGLILAFLAMFLGGLLDDPPMDMETLITVAALFTVSVLGGIGGGCVGGIAAGRLFKEKCYFEVLAKIAGAIGGVAGIVVGVVILVVVLRDCYYGR